MKTPEEIVYGNTVLWDLMTNEKEEVIRILKEYAEQACKNAVENYLREQDNIPNYIERR